MKPHHTLTFLAIFAALGGYMFGYSSGHNKECPKESFNSTISKTPYSAMEVTLSVPLDIAPPPAPYVEPIEALPIRENPVAPRIEDTSEAERRTLTAPPPPTPNNGCSPGGVRKDFTLRGVRRWRCLY
jgi:hypothetical protein